MKKKTKKRKKGRGCSLSDWIHGTGSAFSARGNASQAKRTEDRSGLALWSLRASSPFSFPQLAHLWPGRRCPYSPFLRSLPARIRVLLLSSASTVARVSLNRARTFLLIFPTSPISSTLLSRRSNKDGGKIRATINFRTVTPSTAKNFAGTVG